MGRLNRTLDILKFPSGPKHRVSLLKNMTFTKGNQLFVGDFHLVLDKINADILQFTKKSNWKWII